MKYIFKIVKVLFVLFIMFLIGLTGIYIYAFTKPKLELKSANSIQIYDKDNNLLSLGSSNDDWVKIDDISKHLIDATISVEDKNFYNHKGFDYLRILKAIYINIKNQKISQGASTISQQYVKNLYLDFEKTWKRKFEEAFLTMQLEIDYDKDEILEGYLNTINYGQGNYGIKSASKYYFNKEAKDLNLQEAVILAGISKNPSKYNPVSNYDESLKRAKVVALCMLNNKVISQEEYDSLFKENIEIYTIENEEKSSMTLYYRDAVISELNSIETIPKSLLDSGGIKVYTNLDVNAQNILINSINNNIPSDDKVQVASIMVNPKNGDIIALSGGRNYKKSEYNRVTMAKRQVGSTMKSFLYYAALENNFLSSSTFTSEATTFNLSNNKTYAPTNYNDKYANKPITMAAALALSDNIYAVKTNLYLGTDTLVDTAHRTGIMGNLQSVPSLALGTSELSMIDYARGYTTFASGGYKRDLNFISKVMDSNGNILYEKKYEDTLVLNPNYTYILNEMLTNTTNATFMDYTKPSALVIADKLTRKYSIKTGSTGTDFYLAGYNPDLLMLVWIGYDDGSDIEIEKNKYSKYIFAEAIENYFKDKTTNWYQTPENVVGVIRNAITGETSKDSSNSAVFYYVKGSENMVFNEKE